MNPVITVVLKSLALTITVAGVLSYFLFSIGLPFLQTFIALIVLQFVFFYFYGEYVRRKNIKLQIETELKILEENSKQSASVTCPCDRAIQTTIPISVNGDNSYICPGCNKNVSVYVTTKTAIATTPVTVNPLDTPILVESLDKLIKNNNAN